MVPCGVLTSCTFNPFFGTNNKLALRRMFVESIYLQVGEILTYNELLARYNLQLLLLQRAWQAPWKPETHASFQPSFRQSVVAIAQSTHRLNFPHEVMILICSFLHRDWWEDSRKQCWNYACLCERSNKKIAGKVTAQIDSIAKTGHHEPAVKLERCPRCHISMYCSKNCQSRDLYLWHKARCCIPPMVSQVPDHNEILLYNSILKEAELILIPSTCVLSIAHPICQDETLYDGAQKERGDDDDNDDDESWETMDSDNGEEALDESTQSVTQRIFRYFDEY
jgi:MYND finger